MSTPSICKIGRPRSRAAAKEASREALIAAAIAVFSRKGLDASLDEVCAEAGYTRGAFYVHFKDRDDLIAAVMDQIGQGWLDTLMGEGQIQDFAAVIGQFTQSLKSGAHPVSRSGGVRPYQLLDACVRSPVVREGYLRQVAAATGRIRAVLESAQSAGVVRPDIDAASIAALLEAAVIGLEVLHDLEAPIDLDASAAALVTLLMPPAPGE
jgi:TetR/AcrR family transcriptional regulator, transcriptional repressor for nem operon